MKRNYFFICGCARSGTTALWRLVSAHQEVAVGVERYLRMARPNKFLLSEDLFEESRFFDLHDTNSKSLPSGKNGKYYQDLKSRYNNCKIFGDKIPRLYDYYTELNAAFAGMKMEFGFSYRFKL